MAQKGLKKRLRATISPYGDGERLPEAGSQVTYPKGFRDKSNICLSRGELGIIQLPYKKGIKE